MLSGTLRFIVECEVHRICSEQCFSAISRYCGLVSLLLETEPKPSQCTIFSRRQQHPERVDWFTTLSGYLVSVQRTVHSYSCLLK